MRLILNCHQATAQDTVRLSSPSVVTRRHSGIMLLYFKSQWTSLMTWNINVVSDMSPYLSYWCFMCLNWNSCVLKIHILLLMGSFLWTQFIPLSVGGKELVRSQEADKPPVGLTTDFIHASGRQLAAGLDSLQSLNMWSLPPHFLHSIHRLLLGCHLRSGVGSACTFVWCSQCRGLDTVGANFAPTKKGADFF